MEKRNTFDLPDYLATKEKRPNREVQDEFSVGA